MLTAAFAASFFMRDYNIENRIWHADESEQASTFADLLLNGDYEYNPNGPHGPTLYYYAFACHQLPNIKYFDMAQEANVSADTPVQSKNDGLSIILLRKLLAPWLLIIFVCYLIGLFRYSGGLGGVRVFCALRALLHLRRIFCARDNFCRIRPNIRTMPMGATKKSVFQVGSSCRSICRVHAIHKRNLHNSILFRSRSRMRNIGNQPRS